MQNGDKDMHTHSSFEKEDALEVELIEHYGKFICNKREAKELELDIKVIFLPLCSPNLTHVKYFFQIIKGKMREYHLNSNVNFNNLQERRMIYYSLVDVTLNSVKKLWIEIIQNAKHIIVLFN